MLYRFLKLLAKLTAPFYFSKIIKQGIENIPKKGPLILIPNHQNALLDAIVVSIFSPIDIYYLTRASVFKSKFNKLLRSLNMRPVYRIRDGYESLSKNESVFKECKDILLNRHGLLLFPEADHSLKYYLRPLSRGLSRIVFDTQDAFINPIPIIPVGLNYFNHLESRNKLMIVFGEPIYFNQFKSDSKGAILNEIRLRAAQGMKKTLLIPEFSSQYNAQVETLKHSKANSFEKLKKQLTISEKLVIEERESKSNSVVGVLSSILSEILFLPPLILLRRILRTQVKDPIFYGSIKFAFGMLIFPIWIVLLFIFVGMFFSVKWAFFISFFQLLIMRLRAIFSK